MMGIYTYCKLPVCVCVGGCVGVHVDVDHRDRQSPSHHSNNAPAPKSPENYILPRT